MQNTLNQIIQDFLKAHFAFHTTHATKQGYPGFDERLPDYSEKNVGLVMEQLKSFESALQSIRTEKKNEQIDKDLLGRKIQIQLFGIESQKYLQNCPCYYIAIASNALFSLIVANHYTDPEKTHYLLARLHDYRRFFADAGKNIKAPVTLWTKLAIQEASGLVSYLQETILPFLKKNAVLHAEDIIKQGCHSVFEFVNFLEQRKDCENDFAIGKDNFSFILKSFHDIHTSVEDIRDLGLKQIDELTQALHQQAQEMDESASWQELVNDLKNKHPREGNLLKAYQKKIKELKSFLIKKDLVTLPAGDSLKVMHTPEFLFNSIPYAAYFGPPMFASSSEGLFFVTPVQGRKELLREHCDASFPLTALHEGYPGHHLQFSVQKKNQSDIRKTYDVSSNYEGWTLYCEEMMFRQGFYNPAMRLFQLKDKLWRAARIVVDISMQCYGMKDTEAVEFLVQNAKLSEVGARIDVNWYTQSPTIPMSYLIGMLEVDKLREDYMSSGKTLKDFHDAFLSCGTIPLSHVRRILL